MKRRKRTTSSTRVSLWAVKTPQTNVFKFIKDTENGPMNGVSIDGDQIAKEDTTFLRTLLKQKPNIRKREFAEIMKRHLVDAVFIKKWRQYEKTRLDGKLQDRLARTEQVGIPIINNYFVNTLNSKKMGFFLCIKLMTSKL